MKTPAAANIENRKLGGAGTVVNEDSTLSIYDKGNDLLLQISIGKLLEKVRCATVNGELLSALEHCLQTLEWTPGKAGAYRQACIERAEKAIAKAKGVSR